MAAVLLAATLAWAALAKLKQPERTAEQFAALGLPSARLLSRLVPAAELVVAVLLLVVPGWGGLAAFVLLAAFTVVLVSAAGSPEPLACACFGSASDRPIGRGAVLRNLGLMVMAALAVPLDHLVWPIN